jgi:uncharacterized protein (DUF58 family)
LLVGAGVIALVAVLIGIQELYPVAGAAAVLVAAAWGWMSFQEFDVRIMRTIHPPRVPAGLEARVDLTVRNAAAQMSPPISASDPFDGGKRWARFAVAPLAPGETRVASYRLPTARRGIYRLGPLELEVVDPFGLARIVRMTTPDTSLTVHPRIEPLPNRAIFSQSDQDSRLPRPVLGQGGNEFYGLREYMTGDDLRHVHWPSTARVDDLVIRQPENLWRGRIVIATDLRSAVNDRESVERVLSAVASLATSAYTTGVRVRVVSTAGLDTGYASGRAHGPVILDALAAATTHSGGSLSEGLKMLRQRDPLIVVTTDACDEDDLAAVVRLSGSGPATAVVFERGDERAGAIPSLSMAGRARVVRVPAGAPLRNAWERVRC